MARGLDEILEEGGGRGSGGSYLLQCETPGKDVRVDADGNPTETQLVARVQGELGDATSWLVTLDVLRTPSVPYSRVNLVGASTLNQVLATVTWGQGGAKFDCTIDWRPCSFLLHGAWAEVVCSSSRPSLNQLFRASIVPADAGISRGSDPGLPTRTLSCGLVGIGAAVDLVVPERARAFHVMASAQIVWIAEQFTDLVLPTALGQQVGNNGVAYQHPWVPLHWACRRLKMTNAGAAGTTMFIEFLMDVG